MFGVSTELITKGKLTTVKRLFQVLALCQSKSRKGGLYVFIQ